MRNRRCLLFSIILIGLGLACKKSKLLTYSSPRQIYFQAEKNFGVYDLLDSLTMSFAFATVNDTTVKIPVVFTGLALGKDVTFNVALDPSQSTVKEGTDFAFVEGGNVFHASKYIDTLRIKIIRTPTLKKQVLVMNLKLQPSVDFDTLVQKYGDKGRALSLKYYIDDMILPPVNYISTPGQNDGADAYLGKFTEKKFRTLVLAYGEEFHENTTPEEAYSLLGNQYGFDTGRILYRYLQEQKALGKTVYEDDGTEMTVTPLMLQSLDLN